MSQIHSQTILKKEPRVKTGINSNGDTTIEMNLADAKIILNDLFDKQISDSLISVYVQRDSLNTSNIILLKKELQLCKVKNSNLEVMLSNYEQIVTNKSDEIELLNKTIKQQKKEIFKQKSLKIAGFITSVIIPITIIILTK